jgi:hypothetical protein
MTQARTLDLDHVEIIGVETTPANCTPHALRASWRLPLPLGQHGPKKCTGRGHPRLFQSNPVHMPLI